MTITLKQLCTACVRPTLFLIIFAGFFSQAVFSAPLTPFKADYHVFKDGELVANTELDLKQLNGQQWQFVSASKPTGWFASIMGLSVTETSNLSSVDNSLRTESYRYVRTGKEKRVHLTFNWDAMEVNNTINGDLWKMSIPTGTYDKLSIQLALMTHANPSTKTYHFPVADGGKLKTYEYKIIGTEALETAVGRLDTIKVSRNKVGRKDGDSTLWLAPAKNNLLVRMQKIESDGEVVTLEVTKIY